MYIYIYNSICICVRVCVYAYIFKRYHCFLHLQYFHDSSVTKGSAIPWPIRLYMNSI